MQLTTLYFPLRKNTRGIDVIRGMKSLTAIGATWQAAIPAAEFWKRYDAGEYWR
jgi:hypothetical protein